MTRRRTLQGHLETMGEIRGIMGAMKNMAFAERRKVGRRLEAQGQVLQGIEAAAADFLAFHPQPAPDPATLVPVLVVVGSERGFCGDFNQGLLHRVEAALRAEPAPLVLTVGYKLGARLAGRPGVAATLDGAGVAEEVDRALVRVVAALRELEEAHGPLSVTCLHHAADAGAPVERALFPPFSPPPVSPEPTGYPPIFYMDPPDLFARLVDHELLAVLHAVFLTSLLAENDRRLHHLEGAIRRLDERRRELTLEANALRREEITEEIEMILLNVEAGA
jgi:F-type H+-transporting ATPase subunit gamma